MNIYRAPPPSLRTRPSLHGRLLDAHRDGLQMTGPAADLFRHPVKLLRGQHAPRDLLPVGVDKRLEPRDLRGNRVASAVQRVPMPRRGHLLSSLCGHRVLLPPSSPSSIHGLRPGAARSDGSSRLLPTYLGRGAAYHNPSHV